MTMKITDDNYDEIMKYFSERGIVMIQDDVEPDTTAYALVVKNELSHMDGSVLAGKGFEYISADRLRPKRYYDEWDKAVGMLL